MAQIATLRLTEKLQQWHPMEDGEVSVHESRVVH